jgi:DNA-binding NarL/FixJ family response regulator
VELISRDRADAYAEGARTGAPNAVQVADRFHLLANLGEAVERFLATRHEALAAVRRSLNEEVRRDAAARVAEDQHPPEAVAAKAQLGSWRDRVVRHREAKRSCRLARYERVVELHRAGWSKRAITRELGLDVKTVRKYIAAGGFPELSQFHSLRSRLRRAL